MPLHPSEALLGTAFATETSQTSPIVPLCTICLQIGLITVQVALFTLDCALLVFTRDLGRSELLS
jgi:hypothetical protein